MLTYVPSFITHFYHDPSASWDISNTDAVWGIMCHPLQHISVDPTELWDTSNTDALWGIMCHPFQYIPIDPSAFLTL